MSSRFHFNPKTGQTGRCDAKLQCRFGQTEEQHGATREEARAHYEATMESELLPSAANTEEPGADAAGESFDWPEPDGYADAAEYAEALGLKRGAVLFAGQSKDFATVVFRENKLHMSFYGSSDFEELSPDERGYVASLPGGRTYLRGLGL